LPWLLVRDNLVAEHGDKLRRKKPKSKSLIALLLQFLCQRGEAIPQAQPQELFYELLKLQP